MLETGAKSAAVGRWLVLGAALFSSLGGALIKGFDLAPTTIAFYRSFFAGLVLLPLIPRKAWVFRPIMVPLAVIFGAMVGLYIGAVKATTAANAIFLECTGNVWLVPASVWLFKEPWDRRAILGSAMVVAGCVVILEYGHHGGSGEVRGIVLAIASGVAYAIVMLGLRGLRTLDSMWLSTVFNLGGAIALGAWITATAGPIPVPSGRVLAGLAAFGTIQMAVPYVLFARALRTVPAPEVGLIGLVEPILNPIWAWFLHGEWPMSSTWLGGAFLIAGLAVRYLPFRWRQGR